LFALVIVIVVDAARLWQFRWLEEAAGNAHLGFLVE
jgi:hypothetical protein